MRAVRFKGIRAEDMPYLFQSWTLLEVEISMTFTHEEDFKRYHTNDECCNLGRSRYCDSFNPYGINSAGLPQNNGFTAWTYDIAMAFCLLPFIEGHVYLARIDIERPVLASSIHLVVGTSVEQRIHSDSIAGIYDWNYTLLRTTKDISGAFAKNGITTLELDAPILLLPDKSYYLALLLSGSGMPQLAALPTSVGMLSAGSALLRAGMLPGCYNCLPCKVSVDPLSNAPYFWMGVK